MSATYVDLKIAGGSRGSPREPDASDSVDLVEVDGFVWLEGSVRSWRLERIWAVRG